MLRLEHIEKSFWQKGVETSVLRDVNLEIEKGEYVAIVGTSGSGKTTLLNILGAMSHPSAGAYFYEDIEVSKLSPGRFHAFRKEHISFVFQNFELMERYNVAENIELPLLAKGVRNRREIVDRYMEEMQISHLAKKLPNYLSGGERQRCAIARALAAGTDLILADEPTGALDSKTTENILSVFDRLHDTGKTIIIITHDPLVAKHCKRVLRMDDGRICEGLP